MPRRHRGVAASEKREPIELVHAVRRAFWHASLMTTGTWVSVVTGSIDADGYPMREGASAKVHRYSSNEAAVTAFDELVAAARDDGFVDPCELVPEPPRASDAEREKLDAVIARLRSHVESTTGLELVGGTTRPAQPLRARGRLERLTRSGRSGPSWELPRTYRAFLERYGDLAVRVTDGRGLPAEAYLHLLDADGAVDFTTELEAALTDHRPFEWPKGDLSRYGLDQCVVFAVMDGWMDGWAFDTRVASADGELAIRRIHDFSADAGEAMKVAWPAGSELHHATPVSFLDWLDERVAALVAATS